MGRPNGIGIALRDGVPVFQVTRYSRSEDMISDAVREAISEGRSAGWFKQIAAECWVEVLREDAEDARRTLESK